MADDQNSSTAITFLKSLNQNLGALVQAFKSVFPQQAGTAPSATAGAATLPGNPVGFIVVKLPNGDLAKIPYYSD
jgi:hypothetical protein